MLKSNVAGSFYPDNPLELKTIVETFLSKANRDHPLPKAIIAPHAGFIYSGHVAAEAYACLLNEPEHFKRIVLVGPSHRFSVDGIAVTQAKEYETPLGNIPIDQTAIDKLLSVSQINVVEQAFQMPENSLETQLPFLQCTLKNFSIVPMLYGQIDYYLVAEILMQFIDDQKTLIVISSDLSHYHDYNTANRIDRKTAASILNNQPEEISFDQACGRTGIQALLVVAKEKQLKSVLLDLRNSGDTAGSKDQVVGYAAFHFYKE